MATYDYYGTEMETGVPIDELAFDTLIHRIPTFPPLSTVQVQDNLNHFAKKVLGEDDSDTDTEPGPEESGDGDGNGG